MDWSIDQSIQVSVGAVMSVQRHILSLVPSVPIVPMGRHRLVCDGPPTMAACGGLLGLVYRQIHPGFCGSGHVWGPLIRHIPSLVPSVPMVLIVRHRLVCDGARLWQPVEDCLDWSIDKSIQVYMEAAMSGCQ